MHFTSIFVIAAIAASTSASPILYPYGSSHQYSTQPVHGNKALARSDLPPTHNTPFNGGSSHYEPPHYIDCFQLPGHECPRLPVLSRRQDAANKDESGAFFWLLPLVKNLFGRADSMLARDFVEVLARQDVANKDESGAFFWLLPLVKNLFGKREQEMMRRELAEVLACMN